MVELGPGSMGFTGEGRMVVKDATRVLLCQSNVAIHVQVHRPH